ncbi:signal recognition particle-docking protein FtsY [Synechococcus sp. CBW1107]|jgi:fused signal recognition particle receptor|uniref:signal recognition particle-docking protein FtsY n=1 Tax=Synechococcus sp. CBW1107 TaxID=2789857 RepID=UPI0018CF6A84|nr:signal recognition particle-docking protein FtsY [Synechococcus sp. CBW1107]QPN57867.1 signal recognition particle-docking protein FtsY [Synechococcus sp. CBW1107]CAK6687768.1 Signal recognition particle receptor FtsY [Synechococcus sp. CBW1107]
MVFDWFRRRTTSTEPEAEPTPVKQAGEDMVADRASGLSDAPDPAASATQPAAEAVVQAPATPAAVDQDALDWARQAYARLKAEQERSRPAAEDQVAEPEPEPVPAATPQPEPVAAAEPENSSETSPTPGDPTTPAASATTPEPPPALEPPGAAGPSLLELAAASRAERQRTVLAPGTDESRPTPEPTAEPPVSTTEEAGPQLGSFDAEFTWSAEVLAAQGRRADQVSLEEIDWLSRLRRGLEKTRRGLVTQLLDNLGDDPLTPEVLDDLETTLLRADVGVQATDHVLEALRRRLNEEVVEPEEGLRFLKEQLRGLLETPIEASGERLLAPQRDRLNVWLLVGVNGVGKTTTLGKLANLAVRSGYSCLIAAADTFRAAAVQQVSVWGERSGVPVIANPSANADPAAVVYDAIGAARSRGIELVLVDTAGRLQTKNNLMEELSKVRRIVDKLAPEAVVESLLVLDASQGQNGLRQAMAFASAAGLTGVVLTKLDGSARGGVALAVASEAGLPIRFIGAGEGIRDLRPFNSFEFVEALLSS